MHVKNRCFFGPRFWRHSMCCARTAALQGGNEMPMWMPCWASCSNPSTTCENHAKNCTQRYPKLSLKVPQGGGHRRLPICVQECWGTAMHWWLASAGLHCWRHMGKWKPTFWLQFAQTLLWIEDAGKKHFLTKGAQKTSNIFEKSVPKPFEIEAWSLQNRVRSPPRRDFSRHLT